MTMPRLASAFRLFIFAAVVASSAFAFVGFTGPRDAESVFQAIQRKYSDASSLQVIFSQKDNPAIAGKLTVKRDNKFMIELDDRIVICNGSTMWNYTPSKNKVIVSNYVDGSDAISPQKLFMSFPKTYAPSLVRESRSTGEDYVVLALKPKSQQAVVGGLQKITMKLSPRTLEIAELEIFDGSNTRGWTISGLKTDINVSDSEFEFKATDDIRVIDLR